ncbi:hypothetical protein [Actinorugispora endophytica]|uniref:Uncharacterized protein n=1 Tax=Actinorugispora endophytica TaxID=1605990 RepID=A0A4R6V462_9ACTN|nr:hypothetical protein EV190_105106 [Actinorugispora endophytica]
MDPADRTGAEFTEPGRGSYEVVSVPATRDALSAVRLLPPRLAEFTEANLPGLLALVGRADREGRGSGAP